MSQHVIEALTYLKDRLIQIELEIADLKRLTIHTLDVIAAANRKPTDAKWRVSYQDKQGNPRVKIVYDPKDVIKTVNAVREELGTSTIRIQEG